MVLNVQGNVAQLIRKRSGDARQPHCNPHVLHHFCPNSTEKYTAKRQSMSGYDANQDGDIP